MNRDEVICMAREACGPTMMEWRDGTEMEWEELERFAALVEAHLDKKYPIQLTHEQYNAVINAALADEREACAKIAFNAKTYLEAAAAIRARGQG